MTTHALLKPVTAAPNGIHWDTVCGLRVLMPKQKFKAGAGINVADGWNGMCAICKKVPPATPPPPTDLAVTTEQRSPEQIEAEQRRQEEAGVLAVTFDDTIGEIEENDEIGNVEDEELLSQENEEHLEE